MTPHDQLEPLTPSEGIKLFLEDRRGDSSAATVQSYQYRLKQFQDWCDEKEIENLNPITGRDIQKFKIKRKAEIKNVTLKGQMDTLRVFLRFCESVNAVRDGVAESVISPTVSREENVSNNILSVEEKDAILAYLTKYKYATFKHALFQLLWESGIRTGSAIGIDLDDVHLEAAYIRLRHRPDSETPLKNKKEGERDIALSAGLVEVLTDYIEEHRINVTDEYNRRPLFATEFGRVTTNTFRSRIYAMTRPCEYGQGCPYDRDPKNCEATERRWTASKCPDSISPHAIRRGAITHFLSEDVPDTVVSDRMNVSKDILDKHYDARSNRQKMEQRRGHLPDSISR